MNELALYLWEKFAPDYTTGLAFAIAKNEAQARELIIAALGTDPHEWGPCEVFPLDKPIASAVYGGG
jgi:hypothetical protein